ncbi:MAG: hypothetical protein KJP09_00970 [Bacteroidia bacterium]|nr:hypothetical protein [Bacteroidia bacterium]
MKKLQLLFAAMLIGLTSVTASEVSSEKQGEDLTITKRYRYTQPILFVERGVEFLIFPDGSFDFNTEFGNWSNDDYYYRRNNGRRGSINRTFGTPGSRIFYSSARPRGVRIVHDRWGNVRRIGNVFINYDWNGRVKRVGSVYMRYQRNRLVQVGGLRLHYNKRGKLKRISGHVNRSNRGCAFHGIECTHDHFGQGGFLNWGNDHFGDIYNDDHDDDFYYYRKDGKQKKFKKNKRIKRKRYDD